VITAVDTNALLALLYEDSEARRASDHVDASETALREAYREGKTVVTPVVYAELAADGQFDDAAALDRFLADLSISLVEPSRDALFQAGEAFGRYAERRPDGFQCPKCGHENAVVCEACGADLTSRGHVAADFLIGGHAAADADALLTFDRGFYGTYFPSLTVRPETGE
jgi:predicted nucleic acid-binding protein